MNSPNPTPTLLPPLTPKLGGSTVISFPARASSLHFSVLLGRTFTISTLAFASHRHLFIFFTLILFEPRYLISSFS